MLFCCHDMVPFTLTVVLTIMAQFPLHSTCLGCYMLWEPRLFKRVFLFMQSPGSLVCTWCKCIILFQACFYSLLIRPWQLISTQYQCFKKKKNPNAPKWMKSELCCGIAYLWLFWWSRIERGIFFRPLFKESFKSLHFSSRIPQRNTDLSLRNAELAHPLHGLLTIWIMKPFLNAAHVLGSTTPSAASLLLIRSY